MTLAQSAVAAGAACVLCCVMWGGARAPAAPSDLRAVPASASHFDLAWTDNADNEEGFRIERRKAGEKSWTLVGRVPAGATAFQSVGCLKQTVYHHRVCAVNRAGRSAWAAAEARTGKPLPARRGREIAPVSRPNPRNGEGAFIRLRNGHLLYAYSRYDGPGDLDPSSVAFRTSADAGRTWGGERVVLSDGRHTVGHPGLVRLADGRIGLSYMVIKARNDAKTCFRTSRDEGATWSAAVAISDGLYGYITAPHDSLRLYAKGRLVQVCHGRDGRRLRTLIYTSDDGGTAWVRRTKAGLIAPGKGLWEGSIARLPRAGHLLLYGRTDNDWFWESRSADNGTTWSKPVRSALRNPQAPAKLYNVPGSKAIVLLQNPYVSGEGKWPNGERWILASMVTTDGGRTWHGYRQLEYTSHDEWYHYPCLYFDFPRGGSGVRWAHVAYHYGRTGATHQSTLYQRLPADWFTRGVKD